ncbi:MAG: bacillithiol biosynthesis BshC [Planctomycetota bacterium]|nr:bacillithiol biosynthesis BshC [Planctomycetota bacterium]
MKARTTVTAAPAFAGGRLQIFNRVLLAAARAGSLDEVELVFDENSASAQDLVLRVVNARGDPVGIPAPHRGIIRDERERGLWSAALRDVMPPTRLASEAVERFLPQPEVGLAEASVELWTGLLPGLKVRRIPRGEPCEASISDDVALVWVGEAQRRTLEELGVSAEEVTRAGEEVAARYRPALQGELADETQKMRGLMAAQLSQLRALALEVNPTLIGAWSRMERSMRRGFDDFTEAAERCLDNHSGIRRTRWHRVAQALRPADESQERGLSLLAAVALLGLNPELWRDYVGSLRNNTSGSACILEAPLFLDC